MHDKETADALRFLGLSGSAPATPEEQDRARRLIHAQHRIHEQHAAGERYYARVGSLPGHIISIFQQIVPPPRPVREILADALAAVGLSTYQNLELNPGSILLDFSFPTAHFGVVLGVLSDEDGDSLSRTDWQVMRVRPDGVRRAPKAIALMIKGRYLECRKARALRDRRTRGHA